MAGSHSFLVLILEPRELVRCICDGVIITAWFRDHPPYLAPAAGAL
jgi:hypothetical protein